jgi:hypothetical protein
VHLADARRGRWDVVEGLEPPAPVGPELLGQHGVHGAGRQGRRRLLQLGERDPVRRGDVLGQAASKTDSACPIFIAPPLS